jgi:hypothetical protein
LVSIRYATSLRRAVRWRCSLAVVSLVAMFRRGFVSAPRDDAWSNSDGATGVYAIAKSDISIL